MREGDARRRRPMSALRLQCKNLEVGSRADLIMDLDTEEIIEGYGRDEARDEIEVGREYGYNTNIRRIIWNLVEGDKVTVEVERQGNPQYNLLITEAGGGDEAVGIGTKGSRMYFLLPEYWGPSYQYNGRPWLRTYDGWDSRGQIWWLRVEKLVEEPER